MGHKLDILARLPLWSQGLDYKHGTGSPPTYHHPCCCCCMLAQGGREGRRQVAPCPNPPIPPEAVVTGGGGAHLGLPGWLAGWPVGVCDGWLLYRARRGCLPERARGAAVHLVQEEGLRGGPLPR